MLNIFNFLPQSRCYPYRFFHYGFQHHSPPSIYISNEANRRMALFGPLLWPLCNANGKSVNMRTYLIHLSFLLVLIKTYSFEAKTNFHVHDRSSQHPRSLALYLFKMKSAIVSNRPSFPSSLNQYCHSFLQEYLTTFKILSLGLLSGLSTAVPQPIPADTTSASTSTLPSGNVNFATFKIPNCAAGGKSPPPLPPLSASNPLPSRPHKLPPLHLLQA